MRPSQIFKAAAKAKGVSAKFSVKKIDRGWERFANAAKSIQTDKSFVKAGLLQGKAGKPRKGKKGEKTLTNVQVGIANEFGTRTQPARPFIRPAFAKNRGEYMKLLALFVKAHVMTGRRTYGQTLGLIGQRMAADMKNYVTQGPQIPPPNSGYPNTTRGYWAEKLRRGYWKVQQRNGRLAKKNKPVPEGPIPPPRTLVDTGAMVNAITYGVVARSSGDARRASK